LTLTAESFYIPNMTHNDDSKLLEKYGKKVEKKAVVNA